MQKVIFTQGLSGSGKTTWANSQVKQSNKIVNINRDDLRKMFYHQYKYESNSKSAEKFIISIRNKLLIEALNEGKSVILSDTNLNPKSIEKVKILVNENFKDTKILFEIKSFLDIPIETCIKNDLMRAESVGAHVIKKQYKDYLKYNNLIDSSINCIKPLKQNSLLPRAIICDLDGTLALFKNIYNENTNSFIDLRGAYDASNCDNDIINSPVQKLIEIYHSMGVHILFVSGRIEIYRNPTEQFINKHFNKLTNYKLLMRLDKDFRKDNIIKKEIYDKYIKDKYFIDFVLDDRNQVVKMWRDLGLTCFQVAEGDF